MTFQETIHVRKGEELNQGKLRTFLVDHFLDLPHSDLEIKQFSAGHSNLTYLLKIGDWEAVLRRPPLGPVAEKAHDMKREYTILSELHPHFPTAPKPFLFSDDKSVIGSPFFIMERRKGVVLDTEFPDSVAYEPSLGEKISRLMVETLVELHDVDYEKTNLLDISRPVSFMERQVHGWIKRYKLAQTDDVPHVEKLMKWLEKHIPDNDEFTVIHYDYKLNNAMFSEDFSELTGLFDWEMTTIGDPLADLGAAMSYWIQKDDPEMLRYGLGKPSVTVMDGFYTRDRFLDTYAQLSGRDLSNIDFYIIFAYFKLAVICQQIYYRYKKGQTDDPRFQHFGKFVNNLITYAVQLIH